MNITVKLVPFVLAALVSSAAVAETVLDTSTPASGRASLNKMAVECDGETRGQCYFQLNSALKKIDGDYFNRFRKEISDKGISGSSPAYQAHYEEMMAVRNKALNGLTRAEILRRAAALK